jgi:hypothetical protein
MPAKPKTKFNHRTAQRTHIDAHARTHTHAHTHTHTHSHTCTHFIGLGHVIVDDNVDTLNINTTPHEVSGH